MNISKINSQSFSSRYMDSNPTQRYCENDSIAGIDPNGEFVITAAGAIALASKAALAYGYTKIIFHSIEEITDYWKNGSCDEQQWKNDVISLVAGKVIGKVTGAFTKV